MADGLYGVSMTALCNGGESDNTHFFGILLDQESQSFCQSLVTLSTDLGFSIHTKSLLA